MTTPTANSTNCLIKSSSHPFLGGSTMRVVYALGNSGMVVKISEAVPALSVILDGEREFRARFALADWMEDVNNSIPAIVSK